jgi:hypothetical protein
MRDYRASAPINPMSAPLVSAGRFKLGAIMRRAVAVARTLRAGGKSWAWRMSVALKSAWSAAKRELTAARSRVVPATEDIGPMIELAGLLVRLTPEQKLVALTKAREIRGLQA